MTRKVYPKRLFRKKIVKVWIISDDKLVFDLLLSGHHGLFYLISFSFLVELRHDRQYFLPVLVDHCLERICKQPQQMVRVLTYIKLTFIFWMLCLQQLDFLLKLLQLCFQISVFLLQTLIFVKGNLSLGLFIVLTARELVNCRGVGAQFDLLVFVVEAE